MTDSNEDLYVGFCVDPTRELSCTDGHDKSYWSGIGATCLRCGRVEIDGEFYGYDEIRKHDAERGEVMG